MIFEDEFGNKVNPIIQVVFDTHTVDKPRFSKSLAQGMSLLTKLAMAVITYGTFGIYTLAAHMASASFSTLCAETTTAFIENDANLGRTFKAVASDNTLKAVVRSAATAGIVHGLTSAFSDTVTEAAKDASTAGQTTQTGAEAMASNGTQAALSSTTTNVATSAASKPTEIASKTFGQCVQDSLIQSIANVVVSSVMDGIPIDKLLTRELMSAAINAAAAYGAGQIGGKYLHKKIGTVEHKIYHGLLGAGFGAKIASIDKRDTGLGALSGMMGAIVAETVAELTTPESSQDAAQSAAKEGLSRNEFASRFSDQVKRSTNYGNLSAALSAFALGLEVDIAHATAVNATSHNHSSMMAVMRKHQLLIFIENEFLTEAYNYL